jgi:membrane protease YdiL (CAAX protease family)
MIQLLIVIAIIFLLYPILSVGFRNRKPQGLQSYWLWRSIYYWIYFVTMIALSIFSVNNNWVFRLPTNIPFQLILGISIGLLVVFVFRLSTNPPINNNHIGILNYLVILPLTEEISFRGILLPLLINFFDLQRINPVTEVSIVLNAILFTGFHFFYMPLNKKTAIYFFFFFNWGIVFSLLASITNSILLGIVFHLCLTSISYRTMKNQKTE